MTLPPRATTRAAPGTTPSSTQPATIATARRRRPSSIPGILSPVAGTRSILKPNGRIVPGSRPRMTDEMLLEAVRWMLMSRAYDERAIALQRQGLYGVFSPGLGQEASIVGSAMALDPARDWIVPQYRELVAMVRHGYPLERLAGIGMGRITEST